MIIVIVSCFYCIVIVGFGFYLIVVFNIETTKQHMIWLGWL